MNGEIAMEISDGTSESNDVPEIPNGTNTEMNAVSLEEAMLTMERIRSKSLKAAQHEQFLSKCLEAGRIPKGLRIQQKEVHLMNMPTAANAWKKLAETYALTERSICYVLIEHYASVQTECEEAGNQTDKRI